MKTTSGWPTDSMATLWASPVVLSETAARSRAREVAGRYKARASSGSSVKHGALLESRDSPVTRPLKLDKAAFEWKPVRCAPGDHAASQALHGNAHRAAGPVVGRSEGRRLTLRYPLTRWGLVMHQTLDLASDGQTLENYGSIRFLGMPIGELEETISLSR